MDSSIPRSPPLAYSSQRQEPVPSPEYDPSVSFSSYNEAVSFVQMYSPRTTIHSVELVKPKNGLLQALKRALAPMQAIATAITVSSVMSGIVPLTQQELASGGPVMMVSGFAFAGLMAFTIALSLADISSGFPNVKGGLIEYSHRLSPPHLKRISSWVVGWLHFFAFVTGVTGCAFSFSLFATSAIEIATGVLPKRWLTVLIHIAVSISFGLINAFHINIDMFSVAWQFFGPMVVLITIASSNRDPPSVSWVFTHFENKTGFHSTLYVVLLGLVQGAFTLTGYDAPIHTLYNMPNAAWQVPQGIICGFLISFFMGELVILTLLFGIQGQDLASVLSPVVSGNAVIEIFVHLISRAGTNCILVIFIGTFFFCGQGILKTVSAIGHEMATKGAFPRSEYLAQVGSKGQPARVGWLCVTISCCIGVLYLGNSTLLGAMSSAIAIEMNLAYTTPIALRLMYPNPTSFQPGPFSLGRLREPIAMVATWWSVIGTLIFSIPGVYPVTLENMNYAGVLLLASLSFILGYWYYSARHWFGLQDEYDLDVKRISSAIELEQMRHAPRCSVGSKNDLGHDPDLDEIENWLDNLERDLYRMK